MDRVTPEHAKQHLEELIARGRRGEDVRITDPNMGSFRVVPEAPGARPQRVIGQWKGKIPARLMEPLADDELRWLTGDESQ